MNTIITTLDDKNHTILSNNDFLELIKKYIGNDSYSYLQNIFNKVSDYNEIVTERDNFEFQAGNLEDEVYELENELEDIKDQLEQYKDTGLTPAVVAELVQAKRDGRLVILPCKAGDTVYFYGKPCRRKLDYNECEKAFDKKGNINIWCEKDCLEKDIVISRKFGIEDFKNINKTVFLTKAEAQAALDRMEGRNDS